MGVCFDILAGTLTIGGRAIPAGLMPDGGLFLGEDAGLVLRPLRFGERAAAVAIGSAADDTERGVAAAILAFATVVHQAGGVSVTDPAIAGIAALHLCGADVADLPSFAATALLLGRAAGWSLADLGEARATDVDRLARTLAPMPADDGWTRVRFVDGCGAAVEGFDQVLRGLARNLLDRSDATATESVAGLATGAAAGQAAGARASTPALAGLRAAGAADAETASPVKSILPSHPAGLNWLRDAASTAAVPSPDPAPIIATRRNATPQQAGPGRIAATAPSPPAAAPESRFRLPIRATSNPSGRQAANSLAANDAVAVASLNRARPTVSGASAVSMPAWDPDAFPNNAGTRRTWATEPITGAQRAIQPAASTVIPQAQPNEPPSDPARDWDADTLIEAIAERLHDAADLRGIDR